MDPEKSNGARACAAAPSFELLKATEALHTRRRALGIEDRPEPGSAADAVAAARAWGEKARAGAAKKKQPVKGPEPARVFGCVLAAIQQRHEERIGQLWFLMRAADPSGSGWIHKDQIRELSPTGWPNTRRLLREGREIGYFRKGGDYYGYISEKRLCVEVLGLNRVTGWAVEIPLEQLQEVKIASLRALFHDAYHVGRGDNANPIARGRGAQGEESPHSVKGQTSRGRATQRRYEARRRMKVQPQLCFLGEYEPGLFKRLRMGEDGEPGQPCFVVRRGRRRKSWIAKRLANRYSGTLRTAKRSRRWLNRRISLVGRAPGDSSPGDPLRNSGRSLIRRYHGRAKLAEKAARRERDVDHWLEKTRRGRFGWWLGLPATAGRLAYGVVV